MRCRLLFFFPLSLLTVVTTFITFYPSSHNRSHTTEAANEDVVQHDRRFVVHTKKVVKPSLVDYQKKRHMLLSLLCFHHKASPPPPPPPPHVPLITDVIHIHCLFVRTDTLHSVRPIALLERKINIYLLLLLENNIPPHVMTGSDLHHLFSSSNEHDVVTTYIDVATYRTTNDR